MTQDSKFSVFESTVLLLLILIFCFGVCLAIFFKVHVSSPILAMEIELSYKKVILRKSLLFINC